MYPKAIQEEPEGEEVEYTSDKDSNKLIPSDKDSNKFIPSDKGKDDGKTAETEDVYVPSQNSVVFSLKNQVGGLARALHVFKVMEATMELRLNIILNHQQYFILFDQLN